MLRRRKEVITLDFVKARRHSEISREATGRIDVSVHVPNQCGKQEIKKPRLTWGKHAKAGKRA